jgi:hypothetical protein
MFFPVWVWFWALDLTLLTCLPNMCAELAGKCLMFCAFGPAAVR